VSSPTVSSCTAINYCCYFTYSTTYNGATITSQTTCLQYTTASQTLINSYASAAGSNAQYSFTSSVNCGSNQMINTTTGATSNTQLTTTSSSTNAIAAQIQALGVLISSAATGSCFALSTTSAYNSTFCGTNSTSSSACCYFSLTNTNQSTYLYSCIPSAIASNSTSLVKSILSSNATGASQISYYNSCESSILSVVLKYLAILITIALF